MGKLQQTNLNPTPAARTAMKFRLTIHPAFDLDMQANLKKEFETKEEMVAAKDACADLLLFVQDEMTIMKDYSNMFIEEVFEDGEWLEFEPEE